MRKALVTLSALGVSALVCLPAAAATVAYEGFNYSSGAQLWGQSGGTGWNGAWRQRLVGTAGVTPAVSSTGLSYVDANGNQLTTSGLAAVVNNTGGTQIGFRDLAIGRTTETWMSFLIDPGSSGNFIGMTLYDLSDNNGAPNSIVGIDQRLSTDGLRLTALGDTGHIDFDPVDDTTVFTVLHLVKGGGTAGADLIEVFYNPLLNSTPATAFDSINVTSGSFDRVRIAATIATPALFDEFRVGDSFADVAPYVVPEPSTCGLLALGLGALFARRRQKV
jgi:hypothetical protein